MAHLSPLYAEHPQDVLNQWLSWRREGPVALAVVIATAGGSVRSPGALMAVAQDGRRAGYISGGCVDADVALQAREAIEGGQVLTLKYGAGSPFIDMPLPCGGTIELAILPDADEADIRRCHDALCARRPARLVLPALDRAFGYTPRLKVRIAGRGADALALARLVEASGFELVLQLRDGEDVEAAEAAGFADPMPLQSPRDLPPDTDDAWTAFILMFHDADWESALLKQALDGDAFYVGAVGSRRTHQRRRERLQQDGVPADRIDRVHGPVGLVPSMREASMLAVSTLGEIIGEFRHVGTGTFAETAVLLLAAGQSQRFAGGDKLLAPLNGKPVLAHAAGILANECTAARICVVGPDQPDRRAFLETEGWQVLVNPDAASGQATSLRTGMEAVAAMPGVQRVLILLADMPFVPEAHVQALNDAASADVPAVMSITDNVLCPPATFARETFPRLMDISGDTGAKAVFKSLSRTATLPLPPAQAIDIDTVEDLARASAASSV